MDLLGAVLEQYSRGNPLCLGEVLLVTRVARWGFVAKGVPTTWGRSVSCKGVHRAGRAIGTLAEELLVCVLKNEEKSRNCLLRQSEMKQSYRQERWARGAHGPDTFLLRNKPAQKKNGIRCNTRGHGG